MLKNIQGNTFEIIRAFLCWNISVVSSYIVLQNQCRTLSGPPWCKVVSTLTGVCLAAYEVKYYFLKSIFTFTQVRFWIVLPKDKMTCTEPRLRFLVSQKYRWGQKNCVLKLHTKWPLNHMVLFEFVITIIAFHKDNNRSQEMYFWSVLSKWLFSS